MCKFPVDLRSSQPCKSGRNFASQMSGWPTFSSRVTRILTDMINVKNGSPMNQFVDRYSFEFNTWIEKTFVPVNHIIILK